MDLTGRDGWHWAQTRVAQIVLFWGVLELILRTLDAVTKSDMLPMLRESLGPDLRFMTDPWLAVIMVALALTLLAGRNMEPAQAKDPEEPEPENRFSVVEAAAIPFFLAFVCGVVFPAFESSYPNRPQVALRPNLPAMSANAGRALPRRQRSASADATAGGTGEKGAAGQLPALPELTPALEGSSASAAAAENPLNAGLPALGAAGHERDRANEAAAKQGVSGAGNEDIGTPMQSSQQEARSRMEAARREKNWRLLASLSESAIADRPQWLEAYWYAGEAYAHLGEAGRAIERLEYVTGQGTVKAEDRSTVARAAQLLESLQQPTH